MSTTTRSAPERQVTPTEQEIAARAYEIWLAKGGNHGHHEDDWRDAERDLRSRTRGKGAAGGYAIMLSAVGNNKIGVIRELREAGGLDLAEARNLCERVPQAVIEAGSRPEAEGLAQRLVALGARAEVVRRS